MRISAVIPAFTILLSFSPGAGADATVWSGVAMKSDATMPIVIRLQETAGEWSGSMDLPDTQRIGMPMSAHNTRGKNLELDFGDGEPFGGQAPFQFRGKVSDDGYEGELAIRELKYTFKFTRSQDDRPYTVEEVTFQNGDVTLAGSVFAPKSPGPHPGIVLIHGSGDNERWWRFGHADYFARLGFAALVFDKRGNGGSSGDWRTVGFEPLARDGLAGVHLLQARGDVDPKRIGFWGISQAGWIMPLAASIEPDNVDFIVTTSGATVSVAEEIKFDYIVRLRDAGYPADVIARADNLLNLDHHVTMTGEGYDELRELVKAARQEPWWKTFEYSLTPAGARAFSKLIEGFDPRPILDEIDTPILWLYGEEDKSVEPSKSIAILDEIMAATPKPWTIKTFPDADHGLRTPPDWSKPFPLQEYATGHWETIAGWLQEHVLSGT